MQESERKQVRTSMWLQSLAGTHPAVALAHTHAESPPHTREECVWHVFAVTDAARPMSTVCVRCICSGGSCVSLPLHILAHPISSSGLFLLFFSYGKNPTYVGPQCLYSRVFKKGASKSVAFVFGVFSVILRKRAPSRPKQDLVFYHVLFRSGLFDKKGTSHVSEVVGASKKRFLGLDPY